jgi:hypothetical protein
MYTINVFAICLVLFLAIGCGKSQEDTQANLISEQPKEYGQKIGLTETTRISTILASPKNYEGERVLVQGEILEVCPRKGCWLEIASDKPGEKIRIKVQDDVIVFPLEAKGKVALVEGEVEELELTKEQAISWYGHLAEEKGESFDSTSVTGPIKIYQIRGIGAKI